MTAHRSVHIPYNMKLRPYHKVVAEKAIKLLPHNGNLIEIGCGVGITLELIKKHRPDVHIVAADIDSNCLQITGERVPDAKQVTITEDRPFTELGNGYDLIIASHVVEHLKNPYESIKQFMEMLKPGGHLIVAVPNPVRPNIFFGNILKKDYVNRGHVYAWDRSHWINFLERILHLNVIEYPVDFIPVFPFSKFTGKPWARNLQMAFAKAIPWWSFSNIAVVRK
jgi:2-polyprenyl-3-methyl-5-hydroxy-6-metoxy-1,4-benzoquinol methylase